MPASRKRADRTMRAAKRAAGEGRPPGGARRRGPGESTAPGKGQAADDAAVEA